MSLASILVKKMAELCCKRWGAAFLLMFFASGSVAGSLSVNKSPSYDGSFVVSWSSSLWDAFKENSASGTFTVRYTPAAGYGEYVESSDTVEFGETSYSFTNRTPGDYLVMLHLCGTYDSGTSGGCGGTHEISVEVKAPVNDGPTVQLNLKDYDIYYGDIDNDGTDGDIYFHGKDRFILIAGDISIPIFTQGPPSFVVPRYSNNVGYKQPSLLDVSDENLAAYTLATLNSDYYSGDMNGDGAQDYFIRGQYAGYPALTSLQTESGYPEFFVPQLDIDSRFDPSDRANVLALLDDNLDGRMDLVLLSGIGGYILDVVYSDEQGQFNQDYYVPADLSEVLDIETYGATSVGKLNGEFRVNEGGAATYNVPIMTPQGTAGSTPSVALSYSSQGGNGILGTGWSLSAYSMITRCQQTLHVDGVQKALTFTNEDRFCLDGQRLLLVTGEQGKNLSTYQPLINTNALITLHNDATSSSSYFEVIRKDGSKTHFGKTGNSKQTLAAAKTVLWAQSTTEDNAGNQILYSYTVDAGGKNFRITDIKYAYGSGTVPNARIKFNYEYRKDVLRSYIAGYSIEQKYRLNEIEVFNTVNSEVNIRDYIVHYARDLQGEYVKKRSIVAALQECVGSTCTEATKFDWELVDGALNFSRTPDSEQDAGSSISPLTVFKHADINGDGVQDLVWMVTTNDHGNFDNELHYAISENGVLKKSNFTNHNDKQWFAEGSATQTMRMQVLDYNGDGRQDVAVYRTKPSGSQGERGWHIYLSVVTTNSGVWRLTHTPIDTGLKNINTSFLDINGDGLPDALYEEKVRYLERAGQSLSSNTYYTFGQEQNHLWGGISELPPAPAAPPVSDATRYSSYVAFRYHGVGDFNGDGRLDAVGGNLRSTYVKGNKWSKGTRTLTENLYVLLKTDDGLENVLTIDRREETFEGSREKEFEKSDIYVVDVNADGLSDILYRDHLTLYYYENNGSGLEPRVAVKSFAANSAYTSSIDYNEDRRPSLQFVDYNGDGYLDLIDSDQVKYRSGLVAYYWSPEQSTYSSTGYLTGLENEEDSAHIFMDADGDGITDYVTFAGSTFSTYLNDTAQTHDLIKTIDRGNGDITDIRYGLINKTAYTALDAVVTRAPQDCSNSLPYSDCQTYGTTNKTEFYTAINSGVTVDDNPLDTDAPVFQINAPYHVVTRVSVPSPSTNLTNTPATRNGNSEAPDISATRKAETAYYYGEAKVQPGGAGYLGFKTLRRVNLQTQMSTVTTYRQDFPFVGQPLSTVVWGPYGTGILSESHNVYGINGLPSDAAVTAESGVGNLGPIQPYIAEVYEVNYSTSSSDTNSLSVVLKSTAQNYSSSVAGEIPLYNTSNPITCVHTAGQGNCPTFTSALATQAIAKQVVTQNRLDGYGNITSQTVTTKEQNETVVQSSSHEYGDGLSVQLHGKSIPYAQIARITRTDASTTRNGVLADETAQYSLFEYYSTNTADGRAGMLKSEEIFPADSQHGGPKTAYKYNTHGNLTEKAATGWDGVENAERKTNYEFDATGRFTTAVTDSLDHRIEVVNSRNAYGSPVSVSGVNGVDTVTSYDTWGRTTRVTSNVGTWQSTGYYNCTSTPVACPALAKSVVVQYDQGAGAGVYKTAAFFDVAGREIRTSTLGFDGHYSYVDTEYDVNGRAVRVSNPYFAAGNEAIVWTRNYYDTLGRSIALLEPNGAFSTMAYDGYAKSMTNDKGQSKVEITNGLGELVAAIDNLGTAITYGYDAGGNLQTTTAHKASEPAYAYSDFTSTLENLCVQPTSNYQVVLCYDSLGRKTQMWDPDKGYWTYQYNAFGELIHQTSANGHTVSLVYDKLGRTVARTDTTALGVLEGTTSWYYDTHNDVGQFVENAMLKPTAIVYTEGGTTAIADGTNYGQRILYDTYGQPVSSLTLMPDGSEYESRTEYDYTKGRVAKSFNVLGDHLKRNGQPIADSGIENHYNSYGMLERITNIEDGEELYKIVETNARGQLTQGRLGGMIQLANTYNHYTGLLERKQGGVGFNKQDIDYRWDTVGNLTYRENNSGGLNSDGWREDFCYDELNRYVKTFKNAAAADCPTDVSENDVRYDVFGNITYKHDVGEYNYALTSSNGNRAGPHAVTSTISSGNGVENYHYDANGNMLGDGSRTFAYSTYDMVTQITKGDHTTKFRYGPDRSRYYREDVDKNNKVQKTWYLGNVEKIERSDNKIEWRRTLMGGTLHTYVTDAAGNIESLDKFYLLKDHLGSTDIVLDAAGNVKQLMSFDAWGERRNPDTTTEYNAAQLVSFDHSITTRGFTGHEMLDEVGVVHMNGRIYDARLGRFLQADPYIQAPTNTQSLNRYSYVINNPLNATDPSGYIFQSIVAFVAWLGTPAGIYTVVTVSTVYAMANTWSNNGSLTDTFTAGAMAAVSSVITMGVGQIGNPFLKVIMAGMVGGVFAEAGGGEFGAGFVAAGIGSLAGLGDTGGFSGGRLIASAIAGGVSSRITGGKFANGAVTSAFWYVVGRTGEKNRPLTQQEIENMENSLTRDGKEMWASTDDEVIKAGEESAEKAAFERAVIQGIVDAEAEQRLRNLEEGTRPIGAAVYGDGEGGYVIKDIGPYAVDGQRRTENDFAGASRGDIEGAAAIVVVEVNYRNIRNGWLKREDVLKYYRKLSKSRDSPFYLSSPSDYNKVIKVDYRTEGYTIYKMKQGRLIEQ